MRKATKGYFLKEYGSWSVLIVAFIAGLAVTRTVDWQALPLFLALALLINSKQAFTTWVRKEEKSSLLIFIGHLFFATIILVAIFGSDIPRLLPLLIFPAAYLVSNKIWGEHFVLTEALGFMLISLAAVLAKFLVIGRLDVRLFIAVAVYFIAGVFKVKALLQRKMRYRVMAVVYLIFAAFIYRQFYISLVILLPLADNLVAAATLYKIKLKTTGWIELSKSLIFLVLMIFLF